MEMTEAEVIRKYIDARYKTRQVKILAELNNCSTATIEGILIKNGITYPPVKGPKTKAEQEVYDRIMNDEVRPVITKPLATPEVKKIIPDAVANVLNERIAYIDSVLRELDAKRKAYLEEVAELREFMGESLNEEV